MPRLVRSRRRGGWAPAAAFMRSASGGRAGVGLNGERCACQDQSPADSDRHIGSGKADSADDERRGDRVAPQQPGQDPLLACQMPLRARFSLRVHVSKRGPGRRRQLWAPGTNFGEADRHCRRYLGLPLLSVTWDDHHRDG